MIRLFIIAITPAIGTLIMKLLIDVNSKQTNSQVILNEINKKMFALNILIQKEKERNRELKKKLGIVEHKNNAATELIYDYKNMYSEEYLRNWSLFFCILIIGSSISKINSKPIGYIA